MFLTTVIIVVVQRAMTGRAPSISWADACAGLASILLLAWVCSPSSNREDAGTQSMPDKVGIRAGNALQHVWRAKGRAGVRFVS